MTRTGRMRPMNSLSGISDSQADAAVAAFQAEGENPGKRGLDQLKRSSLNLQLKNTRDKATADSIIRKINDLDASDGGSAAGSGKDRADQIQNKMRRFTLTRQLDSATDKAKADGIIRQINDLDASDGGNAAGSGKDRADQIQKKMRRFTLTRQLANTTDKAKADSIIRQINDLDASYTQTDPAVAAFQAEGENPGKRGLDQLKHSRDKAEADDIIRRISSLDSQSAPRTPKEQLTQARDQLNLQLGETYDKEKADELIHQIAAIDTKLDELYEKTRAATPRTPKEQLTQARDKLNLQLGETYDKDKSDELIRQINALNEKLSALKGRERTASASETAQAVRTPKEQLTQARDQLNLQLGETFDKEKADELIRQINAIDEKLATLPEEVLYKGESKQSRQQRQVAAAKKELRQLTRTYNATGDPAEQKRLERQMEEARTTLADLEGSRTFSPAGRVANTVAGSLAQEAGSLLNAAPALLDLLPVESQGLDRAVNNLYEKADGLTAKGAAMLDTAKTNAVPAGALAVDMGAAGVQALGDAALSAVSGGAAGAAVGAVRSFGESAQAARQAGATDLEAAAYGGLCVLGDAAISKLTDAAEPLAELYGPEEVRAAVVEAAQDTIGRLAGSKSGQQALAVGVQTVLSSDDGIEALLGSAEEYLWEQMTQNPDAQLNLEHVLADVLASCFIAPFLE